MSDLGSREPSGAEVVDLLPWQLAVRRANARSQTAQLLSREDADQVIQGLSPLEVYYAAKALGAEDAVPLLAVMGHEQIQALFDVDTWHKERFDPADLLVWLESFREAGLERLWGATRALDPEVLALLFRRRLFIAHRPRPDEAHDDPGLPDWLVDPPDTIQPIIQTPDRRFLIAARVEDELEAGEILDEEDRKAVLRLVDDLYKEEGAESAARLLFLALSDLSSSLEEDALRFRNARLEDLGFPPRERAIEIYGPLEPGVLDTAPLVTGFMEDAALPVLHAESLSQGILDEALSAIRAPRTIRRLEGELLALANAALVVDGTEAGDTERLRDVLTRVRNTLELGLTWGSVPELTLDVAVERLSRHPVRNLFRVGHTLCLRLSSRVGTLAASGSLSVGHDPFGLLPDVDRGILDALRRPQPLCSRVLDRVSLAVSQAPFGDEKQRAIAFVQQHGLASECASSQRSFERAADLHAADAYLDTLEELCSFAGLLKLCSQNQEMGPGVSPPSPRERNVDMLFTTAAIQALSGRPFSPAPLPRASNPDLPKVLEKLRSSPTAWETIRDCARDAAGQPMPLSVEHRLKRSLQALETAVLDLPDPDHVDYRFLGHVLFEL